MGIHLKSVISIGQRIIPPFIEKCNTEKKNSLLPFGLIINPLGTARKHSADKWLCFEDDRSGILDAMWYNINQFDPILLLDRRA